MYICGLDRVFERPDRPIGPAGVVEKGRQMSEETTRRRTRVRAWALALGLLVLVVYLGFIALALIRLPGAVGN